MSYSLSAQSATKAELELKLSAELSKVPETQPVHIDDIDPAFNAAKSLIDLMYDDPDRDIYCSVAGSIWKTDVGVQTLTLNISTSYVDRVKS